LSLSQLTGEGGRTQKRRYQKTIYVIPKYFLYAIALSETDKLIGQKEEKLGKKLSKLADNPGFFSRSYAIHRMHYNLSIGAVSQKYRQQTYQGK